MTQPARDSQTNTHKLRHTKTGPLLHTPLARSHFRLAWKTLPMPSTARRGVLGRLPTPERGEGREGSKGEKIKGREGRKRRGGVDIKHPL